MDKSKKFRMPAGIRNKLTAAVAMLLVSSIMMVSSTYAWFTLSTAPEVTGITTSVGANGNLEMALLNGQTFADTSLITSGTGDSSAVKAVTAANITWGNLVDLSAAAYGLNLIALNPAALNYVTGGTTQVNTTNLLQTAVYGADGRVAELKANTVTGVYDGGTAKWVTKQTFTVNNEEKEFPAYGVRAIGVDSSLTTAQIVLNAAKTAVNSGKNNASSPVSTAVGSKQVTFLTLAMSLGEENSTKTSYSADEMDALLVVAKGVQTSLNNIVKTYANAILANLAYTMDMTAEGAEEKLTLLQSLLSVETSAAKLSDALTEQGVTNTYATRLGELATAQAEVEAVIAACDTYAAGTDVANIEDKIVKPLIGTTMVAYDKNGDEVTDISMDTATSLSAIYLTDGLVADVAVDAGTYAMVKMTELFTLTVYAGEKDTANALAGIATAVNSMNIETDESAEKTIADFYGYILDFAFRTNAAESNLQLQTSAVNRVYTDQTGAELATQGSGSTATFAFDSDALTETQVKSLLGAINLVFLNTSDGTIYGTAKLTEVDVEGGEATAKVKMDSQTGDVGTITQLDQNTVKLVSVLVYLDGDTIGNDDVANAASSGVLNLNLQFSSSAELIPMHNTALESMTVYTVSFNANGGVGFINPVKTSSSTYAVPTVDESKDKLTAPKGYTFKGWATTADATDVIESITLEGNTTLYAVWEAEACTVTFNANGGSGEMVDVSSTFGSSYTLPANSFTAPTGKVFGGWSYTATGAAIDTATITLEGNTVLYAVWVAETPAQPEAPVTYTVSIPEGVTGEATATAGQDYTFTVADGYTLNTVTIADNDDFVIGEGVTGENVTTYTIPAADVTGNIVITVG